jgi:hypothetical protein
MNPEPGGDRKVVWHFCSASLEERFRVGISVPITLYGRARERSLVPFDAITDCIKTKDHDKLAAEYSL